MGNMLSKVLYIVTFYRKYARALTFESLWKAAAVLLRDLECLLLLECVLVQAAAVLLRDLALSCRLAGSSCIEGLLLPYSRSLLTLVRRLTGLSCMAGLFYIKIRSLYIKIRSLFAP